MKGAFIFMEQIKIFDDLYEFSTVNEGFPITFNQYLLLGEESLLFHTGNSSHVKLLVPMLKELLGDKSLEYIFISHFESDECGGLSHLLSHFPNVKTICSQVTAMQLSGFGFTNELIIKKPGEIIESKNFKLKFIPYPSEMHLWEGLLTVELDRQLFFSSDLFINRDKMFEKEANSNWKDEVNKLSLQQIPSENALKTLQDILQNINVKFIATGHGPFLKL
jgi:flavorubredoxin